MTEAKETNQELIEELKGIKKELNGIKKKNLKQVLSIIISVILSLIIGVSGGIYCGIHKDDIMMKINPKSYAKATITVLEERLEEEAKLNTGLYYQKSHFDSGSDYKKIFGKELKITEKSISFDYEGTVEAGIKDLSKTKVEIDARNGKIIVKLPAIEITNVNVDSSSIAKINQTKNIFNQLTIEDLNKAYKTMETRLKNDALKNGLIDKAQKNAEQTLTLLFGDATEGYTLEFEWQE